jgi:hypothetical protein
MAYAKNKKKHKNAPRKKKNVHEHKYVAVETKTQRVDYVRYQILEDTHFYLYCEKCGDITSGR